MPRAKSLASIENGIAGALVALSAIAAGLNPSTFPPKYAGLVATIATVAVVIHQALIKSATTKATALKPTSTIHVVSTDGSDGFLTQYDAIPADDIPGDAQACAGYVDGDFASSWIGMIHRFPGLSALQRVVSIASRVSSVARIMDVENGNPTSPDEAAAWVVQMVKRGVYRPGVYSSLDNMGAVRSALAATGLARSQYVLWVADWTGVQHCPDWADACQWTDHGPSGTDVSLVRIDFYPPEVKPDPPKPKRTAVATTTLHFNTKSGVWHAVPASGPPVDWPGVDREASLLVKLNERGGAWTIKPLPFNFEPPK